jgi:hypothetical protein
MTNAFYLLIDISAFVLFAFLHSFLASLKVKNFFAAKLGSLMAFYRLAYNLLSLWMVWYMYEYLPRPDFELYDLNYPYDFLMLIPQFLALGGLIWTSRYFSGSEFLGITQIKRWIASRSLPEGVVLEHAHVSSIPEANTPDEKLTLRIDGPYKVVRHPLYLFSILFLMLRPTMDLFYLVFLVFIIAYFYIGSFYEERKLVTLFGDQYIKYQASVPRLFGLGIKTYH